MALIQLNKTMVVSWKGGQETYNLIANTLTDVPEDVGNYIKNSPFYADMLVFYESFAQEKKKKEETSSDQKISSKSLNKFLQEIKEENKKSLDNTLIPENEKEVDGLAQLMEENLPTKVVRKSRTKTPKKSNKKS